MARHGTALVYSAFVLIALVMLSSLALDWGNVLNAKRQLQDAVDASARYAAMGLSSGAAKARTNAIAAAANNEITGTSLALLDADVVTGSWNASTRTFTPNGKPLNAVRVTGHRTTARNTAIRLYFASLLGMRNFDLSATATAHMPTTQTYGVIARDGLNMSGNTKLDSYDSSAGTYASTTSANATVAGNFGYMNINGTAKIEGSIFYTGNQPNGAVTGSKNKIPSLPATPTPTTPSGATNHGNYNGGNLTLNSGNHYFTSFSASSGTITINATNGPVKLYVNGAFSIAGNATFAYAPAAVPANMELHMVASAGVDLNNGTPIYAVVNAPNSPLNINGNANLMGSAIVKQISLSGNGGIHQDLALTGSGSSGSVSLVQ